MVCSVYFVVENLSRVEDSRSGIVRPMSPEKEPVAKRVVSVLIGLNMERTGRVMGVNRLLTSIVECSRRWGKGKVGPVYGDSQVGVGVVDLTLNAMAQIVRQRYKVRWRAQKDDGDYDYRNEKYRNSERG